MRRVCVIQAESDGGFWSVHSEGWTNDGQDPECYKGWVMDQTWRLWLGGLIVLEDCLRPCSDTPEEILTSLLH